MSLLELFVSVDDFCQILLPFWQKKLIVDGSKKRCRTGQLSISEMTPALAAGASGCCHNRWLVIEGVGKI